MKSADLTALTFIADKKRHISPKVTKEAKRGWNLYEYAIRISMYG